MPQQLSYYQKRQAALIHHLISDDYLKHLKQLADDLLEQPEEALERANKYQVDEHLTSGRWGVSDTSANWSTGAWPYLVSIRNFLSENIELRNTGVFRETGVYSGYRGILEYSMLWATEEQEEAFKAKLEKLNDWAKEYDSVLYRPVHDTESNLAAAWTSAIEHGHAIRFPCFRIREDIVGQSGKPAPVTGIYVPRNSLLGTCQFACEAGKGPGLCDTISLNDHALEIIKQIGHPALWNEDGRLLSLLLSDAYSKKYRTELAKPDPTMPGYLPDAATTIGAYAYAEKTCFTTPAPCDWYYLEPVEGEDDDAPDADALRIALGAGNLQMQVEAGKTCPRDGWWMTPAQSQSRRYFRAGETMPAFGGSSYGHTFWQWDSNQSAPKL